MASHTRRSTKGTRSKTHKGTRSTRRKGCKCKGACKCKKSKALRKSKRRGGKFTPHLGLPIGDTMD